jgi:hypothetical protein
LQQGHSRGSSSTRHGVRNSWKRGEQSLHKPWRVWHQSSWPVCSKVREA